MGTFFNRLAISETGIRREKRRMGAPQEPGVYRCGRCQLLLFTSQTRFALGADWASFRTPVCGDHIRIVQAKIAGCERREITCASCGSHLGFMFKDGPSPSRLRFSVILAALIFRPGRFGSED
jgi:peptide-methionine (R)-S-oxide reductase